MNGWRDRFGRPGVPEEGVAALVTWFATDGTFPLAALVSEAAWRCQVADGRFIGFQDANGGLP